MIGWLLEDPNKPPGTASSPDGTVIDTRRNLSPPQFGFEAHSPWRDDWLLCQQTHRDQFQRLRLCISQSWCCHAECMWW